MVIVDQQHNMPTQSQNKAGNVRITVSLWCHCVTIGDVKKQYLFKFCVCVYSLF